jgi:cell division protein FtsW
MTVEARALVLVTAVLVAIGLAVLYSASALQAVSKGSPGHFFVLRQALGVVVGVVAFAVLAKFDAEQWRRWAWPIMGLGLFLMVAVFVPGLNSYGREMGGARRYLFGGSLQPSEFAKFAILVWTPMLIVKKGPALRQFGKGLLPFAVVIGALCVLAASEPDISMALTYALVLAVLLFAGGSRLSHLALAGSVALFALGAVAMSKPHVRERVRSFLAGEQVTTERVASTGEQQYQSLVAVGSGGLLGVGFSQGNQQRGWLPLAYNDFIGSIIGEELGFVGLAGITLAFALYGWLGFRIARQARSPYCALLAIGLTFTTVFTAFVHLGVVIGLVFNTGLTLPFVSYGRSNLLLTLAMTGILVNIGSTRERVYGVSATDPLAPSLA